MTTKIITLVALLVCSLLMEQCGTARANVVAQQDQLAANRGSSSLATEISEATTAAAAIEDVSTNSTRVESERSTTAAIQTTTALETETSSPSEGTAEPETTTAAAPEPEPETTTAAVPEPEPETTTAAAPEPEPETTTAAAPEPEPETTTAAAPEPEPETTTQSEGSGEPETSTPTAVEISTETTISSTSEQPAAETTTSAPETTTQEVAAPITTTELPAPAFVCNETGNFPDPSSCKRYYSCVPSAVPLSKELILHELSCPPLTAYSPQRRRCTLDHSACSDDGFICASIGLYPNPIGDDNSFYYWCVASMQGGFHKYRVRCASGERFEPIFGSCWRDPNWITWIVPASDEVEDNDIDAVKAELKQFKAEEKARLKAEKQAQKLLRKQQKELEKQAKKQAKEAAKAAAKAKASTAGLPADSNESAESSAAA